MTLEDGTSSKGFNKKDLAWKHNYLKDPKDTNSITCLFCGKETKGGIFKEKQHQIEKKGNATRCLKCSEEEREELEYMTSKDDKKDNYSSFPEVGGLENIVDINEEEELKEVNLNRKKNDR